MSDLRILLNSLEETFRINLEMIPSKDKGQSFQIRFAEFPEPYGLAILVRQNPITWQANTVLDNQAGGVIHALRLRWNQEPSEINDLLSIGLQSLSYLELRVNKIQISMVDKDSPWLDAELFGKSAKADENPISSLKTFLSSFVGTVLDIFAEWHSSIEVGQFEGGRDPIIVNRYERSSANRAICLAEKGVQCTACGEDPGLRYKMDGRRIVHIHHLTPLSDMGERRIVNPLSDLVPLCPNCHNVAHKRIPPFTPEEIRALLTN